MMDTRPIGIMDSGLGGLSVIRILNQQLPDEKLIFVGDQGHFPYGTRTQADVCQLALKIGRFFERQNVKMMIVACNTATAAALPTLQATFSFPIIGMIIPGTTAALAQPDHQAVGVIATNATIQSHAYQKTLQQLNPEVKVIEKAAQPLVPIVEHGHTNTEMSQAAVAEQLAIFKTSPVQVLILGCTHFPFLTTEIQSFLGNQVRLVDPAKEVVAEAKSWLTNHEALNQAGAKPINELYSTSNLDDLTAGAQKWLTNQNYTCAHLDI